jgi:hypothetical protein
MFFLRKLLFQAAKRVATDERVQQAAKDAYEKEVKPRAKAAWETAKPRLQETKADIGKMAKETDARRHPARFAGKATKRVLKEFKPKSDKD